MDEFADHRIDTQYGAVRFRAGQRFGKAVDGAADVSGLSFYAMHVQAHVSQRPADVRDAVRHLHTQIDVAVLNLEKRMFRRCVNRGPIRKVAQHCADFRRRQRLGCPAGFDMTQRTRFGFRRHDV